MLVVGKVGWGPSLHLTRLNPDEQLTHISLWSLLAAPLLIGCDLTAMDDFTKALLTNDEILAVNQDPLGKQAVRVDRLEKGCEVWARPLSDGTQAVGLFNRGKEKATAKVDFAKLGLGGEQPVRDLWKRKDVGKATDSWSAEIPPHGAVVIKIGTPKAEE
jgi:alpha-galactosidase